jgi:hypothetical protein
VFVPKPKDEERIEARRLRAAGCSIRTIAERLGISRSSASMWTRDIELTNEQRARLVLADPVRTPSHAAQLARSRHFREERRAAQERGREMARAGDPLHRAGCMLFWAEGSRSRNAVIFSNSDVDMQRHFARFLRRCYGIEDDRFVLSINCHLGHGLSVAEIEAHWLTALELPRTCLRPSIVNRASGRSKRVHRPLRHGTARLVVYSTDLVQSIYGAIQEYAGFDRPEWLDLAAPSQPMLAPHAA